MTTFDADDLNDTATGQAIEAVSNGAKGKLTELPNKLPHREYAQLLDPDMDEAEGRDEDTDDIETTVAEIATLHDVEPRRPELDAVPGTTIALSERLDVSTLGENWQYDWLEFKGDKLGIRLPTRQALAAFSLASSKYVDMQVKNDLTGLFIARHLSGESYGRVFSRLMDPDEQDYTVDTVGELFNAIVTAAIKTTDEKPASKR